MSRNRRQISLNASLRPLANRAMLAPIACGAKSRVRTGHREISFFAVSRDGSCDCPVDCAGPSSAFSAPLPVNSHD